MIKANKNALVIVFSLILSVLLSISTYAAEQDWPRIIKHEKGLLELKHKPLRIISTSPSVTGILLANNTNLLASAATTPSALTDDKGFFTQWAKIADERGVEVLYGNLNFDLEAIIGLQPDLVIGSTVGGDSIIDYYDELEAQGIPTMLVNYGNTSWQDLAAKLAYATGNEQDALNAAEDFNIKIQDAAKKIRADGQTISIIGYNIGATFSVSKNNSPQADILTGLGFKVLPLPDELKNSTSRSADFDFISHENLASAIRGDVVFLLRGDDKDVSAFLTDPILRNLTAVKNHQVYPLGISSFRIDYYSGLEMVNEILKTYQN
ncbi:Fe2+-enterobactin ABC transporter substrate-binding protein (plasmid) [Bartonella sp. HY329]|uniref:Fe2+-enterobactin ABC transporter substrate-binding protein n=1 Tax=unclassified Bartonella TaxID=2645622 RepID=UPI0021C6701D|nr:MULTISPECIES: Fe2+-enterobactin ABC transporter substrate-binding protein [unclassified Bartonella]UXM96455.1 Fe2+-enterobactin ABC transporter substrate-binding protein [Bartonella sp. HY329]UXN10778.1 Fe2+-enterobactin ABC transporter substrate-binding protein [Bartonella sp. HY328]